MTKPVSSTSYTNKDFNSIFEELLDLTKQMSEKWDPTISNESDPGVVLLKTDAIIGDKNNYNIDKNILEAFPETVTQDINARNLYKQLAYHMPWYISATTDITIRYKGEELLSGEEFSIPKFTMVSDANSSVVYTLLQDATFNKETLYCVVPAIEGVINDLKINGSDTITLTHLDNYNRVYLDDYTVAENGIFISNTETTDRTVWQRVDNLLIQPSNTKCYEFGVDSRTEVCYVEFPQDIGSLIESGLNIKYIISNGASGNVSAQTLERFYQETSVEFNNKTLVINSENFDVVNAKAAVNGAEPQSISDAYTSYKKSVGTFNTLVTLRDYMNAIYNSGYVSNVIVSDRTNDLQTSYRIMTDDEVNPEFVCQNKIPDTVYEEMWNKFSISAPNDVNNMKDIIELYESQVIDTNIQLSPFDLKLYLLHNSGNISNIQQYEDSFRLENPSNNTPVRKNIFNYISEKKCIQHNYKELLGDTPCMYQNVFPLGIKIVPTTKLTETQITEVKLNIIKSLYNVVCSRAQEFGQEPDYDLIYSTIKNSDERIKTVILDDFTYITYAVYWDSQAGDGGQFKEIPINSTEFKNSELIVQFNDIALLGTKYKPVDNTSYWNTSRRNATLFIYTGVNSISSSNDYLHLNVDQTINSYDVLKYDTVREKFVLYSNKLKEFQKQVLVKSILSGRTPLYVPASPFKYSIAEQQIYTTDTDKVSTASMISPYSTSSDVTFEDVEGWGTLCVPQLPTSEDSTNLASDYTLKENENIRLLAPSFLTKRSFSNYAKFILQLNADSGVTQRKPVTEATALEADKTYYMSKEDWVKVANNIVTIYNSVSDAVKFGEIEEERGYALMVKWIECYKNFTGNTSAAYPVEVKTYENKGSWSLRQDGLSVYGTLQTQGNMASGVLVNEISETDPVYQTLKGTASGISKISLYEEITTYSIPAETDYQLKAGESITFFWREEDGDDIPYKYECYRGMNRSEETSTKKSPIIKANFAIQGETIDKSPFISNLSSRGEILNGDTGWETILGLYGDNDLSGTKSIDIRSMNQVVLDRVNDYYKQTNKIYFITNTTEIEGDKKYFNIKLSLKHKYSKNSNTICSYRYTLQDNEFFIYTQDSGSSFEMLSAGTLIGIDVDESKRPDGTPIEFKVPAVSVQEIQNNGTSSFYELAQTIPQEYTMFCREQQIYSIVGGDTVHLNITDRNAFWEMNNGDDKLYSSTYNKDIAVPYFCSWKDTYVKGFTLNYTSNNTEITLPKLDIQDDLDCIWAGRSFVNINTSADTSQTIVGYVPDYISTNKTSTQNLILGQGDNAVVYPTYTGESGPEGDNFSNTSVQLRSSIQLDKVGGQNVDISYLDSLGERQSVSLYVYSQNKEFDEGPYSVKDNGVVEVLMNGFTLLDEEPTDFTTLYSKYYEKSGDLYLALTEPVIFESGKYYEPMSYERDVELQEGSQYVFSIYNPSETCKYRLKYSCETPYYEQYILPMSKASTGYANVAHGMSYFNIPHKAKHIKFEFEGQALGGEKLIISKIYKCSLNNVLTEDYGHLFDIYPMTDPVTASGHIVLELNKLDYEGLFKYDYQPEEEKYIKDPLKGESFFNAEHFANPYTIARCALKLSNASDSKVTIVNNR